MLNVNIQKQFLSNILHQHIFNKIKICKRKRINCEVFSFLYGISTHRIAFKDVNICHVRVTQTYRCATLPASLVYFTPGRQFHGVKNVPIVQDMSENIPDIDQTLLGRICENIMGMDQTLKHVGRKQHCDLSLLKYAWYR